MKRLINPVMIVRSVLKSKSSAGMAFTRSGNRNLACDIARILPESVTFQIWAPMCRTGEYQSVIGICVFMGTLIHVISNQ